MGSISIPTIALVAAAGTGVAGAYESYQSGEATKSMDKQKATQAQIQGTQQQIDQRQKLLSALASQNAQAGVGGGSLSKANTMRQIDQAQNDLMVTSANTSSQVSLLDEAGENAAAAGTIGAVSDLASTAGKVAQLYNKS